MRVQKGRRELNLVIDDILTIRRLRAIGVKSLEDSLAGMITVFERLFEEMQANPYLAEGFGYAIEFSRELVRESEECRDFLAYEHRIKKIARKHGVNYTELCLRVASQVLQPLGEFEISTEDDLSRETVEKGKHPKKTCSRKNEVCRADNLFNILRQIYKSGVEESGRFREVYESYSSEVRMLRLAGKDVSKYPICLEELRKRFQESPSNAPIDYTRPHFVASMEALSG